MSGGGRLQMPGLQAVEPCNCKVEILNTTWNGESTGTITVPDPGEDGGEFMVGWYVDEGDSAYLVMSGDQSGENRILTVPFDPTWQSYYIAQGAFNPND